MKRREFFWFDGSGRKFARKSWKTSSEEIGSSHFLRRRARFREWVYVADCRERKWQRRDYAGLELVPRRLSRRQIVGAGNQQQWRLPALRHSIWLNVTKIVHAGSCLKLRRVPADTR